MEIFKTRYFSAWQKKSGLLDDQLVEAVKEIEKGLMDANLGGGLVKKRVGRKGEGKRGGYRTILATQMDEMWFFVYGFAKNERDNIDKQELAALKELASELLRMSDSQLHLALTSKSLERVHYEQEK